MKIRTMEPEDWQKVSAIWKQGIDTNIASFRSEVMSYEDWDNAHLKKCRLVAEDNDEVAAFAVLTPHGGCCAYSGVAEVSIYVDEHHRNKGIGKKLLNELVKQAEAEGLWTLESVIIAENTTSIELHRHCGFNTVGRHEKIGYTPDGVWHDTVVLEYRSKKINY
jgi:phosphinothricin acetyltransferase